MNDFFGAIGYCFPENEKQLKDFDCLYYDYEFKADENCVDPLKILKKVRELNRPKTNVDFHKRMVLAAEITYQLHNEAKFGHLKLQKLMYLCQQAAGISIETNFLRQAMGPYDPKLMRSIDKKFFENGWFEFKKSNFQKYTPLEKSGEHKEWYLRYFGPEKDKLDKLIEKK